VNASATRIATKSSPAVTTFSTNTLPSCAIEVSVKPIVLPDSQAGFSDRYGRVPRTAA
jgi:hypothetical protein